MGNPSTTILYHIIITPTLNIHIYICTHISENIYVTKKTPKQVAKIWLPNLVLYQTNKHDQRNIAIKFCSDCLDGPMVLTLSCRQAIFCLSMPQPWPWVKDEGNSKVIQYVFHSVAVNYRYSRYKIDMKISIDNRYGFSDIDISSF